MPTKKPLKFMAVRMSGQMTELERIRYTDACVDDAVRLLREAAALSSQAFASELMARRPQ